MGVMTCSRKGCEHIMCSTYVSNIGYICSDCQEEFKTFLTARGFFPSTEGTIAKYLEMFIAESKKGEYVQGRDMTINEFFDEHTKKGR
jgi:hypothetical protein